MNQLSTDFLKEVKSLLIEHEGWKNYPYVDTEGKLTIGVGYNLTDRGISNQVIGNLLEEDITFHFNDLNKKYSWFENLSEARKIVLIDMRFNLGAKKFESFVKMLTALENQDYILASEEMLDSKWAIQVKNRANDLALIMSSGDISYKFDN